MNQKEPDRYFAIIGHIKDPPPDTAKIKTILEYVGLEVKFWRFSPNQVFITNQDPRRPPDE